MEFMKPEVGYAMELIRKMVKKVGARRYFLRGSNIRLQ